MGYKDGKIYAITSLNTDKIYIGNTTQNLSHRLAVHKSKYKRYLKGIADNFFTSFYIIDLGDVSIELLEAYPCNTKKELHKREGEYMKAYADILVNRCIAGRTDKQYRKDNKD